MYSVEEIKELLKAFDNSKATKLEIVTEKGEALTIAQKSQTAPVYAPAATIVEQVQPAAEKIPMVGVFYAAPSPDKDPYVSVGSKVNKGDVLCLIEAMKLMNEVTAERSGEITKICVENGDVVEYGEPLFMIK